MDKSINYYLICLMFFFWYCPLFGADQESSNKNRWLTLPIDVHQKIALSCFENDMSSFAPYAGDIDKEDDEIHFTLYDYFIKKGFFPTNTIKPRYLNPQEFNNFRFVNKSFLFLVNNISYESKLQIWYEKRIVLFYDFEEKLFKQLLEKRADNQISIISTALNFFEHYYNLTQPYLLQKAIKSKCLFFVDRVLFSDLSFIAVIFYANLLIFYKNSENSDDPCKRLIEKNIKTSNSIFYFSTNFNFDWLEKSICFYLYLLKKNFFNKNFFNKNFIDQNLLKKFNRLEESFLKFEMKTCSKQELLLSFIDHSSILEIPNIVADEFSWYDNNWLKKFPSKEQKIIWFYYVKVLRKKFILSDQLSYFDFPELLFEIKEWLQDTYPQTWLSVTGDLLFLKMINQHCLGKKILLLLGYLVKNATIQNIFDANLFFKVLNFIFNLENGFVNIIKDIDTVDATIWDENFFEALSQKCFEAVSSENKKHNSNNTLDNEFCVELFNQDNVLDLKKVKIGNNNGDDVLTNNLIPDDDSNKDKQSTSEDKTGRLKKIFFYCVASVIVCCSLYKLWCHIKNYKLYYP